MRACAALLLASTSNQLLLTSTNAAVPLLLAGPSFPPRTQGPISMLPDPPIAFSGAPVASPVPYSAIQSVGAPPAPYRPPVRRITAYGRHVQGSRSWVIGMKRPLYHDPARPLPWHSVAEEIADLNLMIVTGQLNKHMKSCHPAKPWHSRDFFRGIGYHTHDLEG